MFPNRVVAVLTPVLFAPLAGTIPALAAKNFPGVDIPAGHSRRFSSPARSSHAKAAQWTHGWQKYEAREAERERAAEALEAREAAISAREGEFGGSREGSFADSGCPSTARTTNCSASIRTSTGKASFDEPDAEPADR